jgi:hypothetical protein
MNRCDLTMDQLHDYFKKYRYSNPSIERADLLVTIALRAMCGEDVDVGAVLFDAEVRQIEEEDRRRAERDGVNSTKWINTTAQSDLFDNYPIAVPREFVIDGKVIPYYKTSIEQALQYVGARLGSIEHEITQIADALESKRTWRDTLRARRQALEELAAAVRRMGLDPSTTSFKRVDD